MDKGFEHEGVRSSFGLAAAAARRALRVVTLLAVLAGLIPAALMAGEAPLTPDQAVTIALDRHALVKEAAQGVAGAGFDRRSARADLLARATASYRYTRLDDRPYRYTDAGPLGLMGGVVSEKDVHHWDVSLVQPLFAGFALITRYEMSGLAVGIKELELRQAELDVTLGVKRACYNLLLTDRVLLVAEDVVGSLEAHAEDARRYYERGLIRRNDLLRARVALATAVQDREKMRAARSMALSDLNTWLSRDIDHPTRIADIAAAATFEADLADLLATGLRQRPVLRALRLGLETLEQAVRLEKSIRYPEVALIGRYERDGDDLDASHNKYANDHNTSLTLQARWTFFEWGKSRARVNRARSDYQALFEKIRGIEDGIRLEIKDAWLNLAVARRNITTAAAALEQAEENWRITNLGYNRQVATSTEVLDARTDLTGARTGYYQALYGYHDALARLERATGG